MHRFVWDLHFTPPDVLNRDYPISAIYHDTPLAPQGIFAPPGEYIVRLTVEGHEFLQPFVVKGDPRVKVSTADLEQQLAAEQKLVDALHEDYTALQQVRSLRAQLKDLKPRAQRATAEGIAKLDQDAATVEGGGARRPNATGPEAQGLARLNSNLAHVYEVVSAADAAPTTQAVAAADQLNQALSATLSRWNEVKNAIPALDQQLKSAGLSAIDLNKPAPVTEGGGEEDEP
jgi:TolA-binding protein